MTTVFYVLDYKSDTSGCPAFLSANYDPPDLEWVRPQSNPASIDIQRNYTIDVRNSGLKHLAFDFYDPRDPIVSREFCNVCEQLRIDFRAVPIEISIRGKPWSKKKYFYFLPSSNESFLDREKSEFAEEKTKEAGETVYWANFPHQPMYAWIRHFTVKPCDVDMAWSLDIGRLVVSQRFKSAAETANLTAVAFRSLNSFVHDPWHELANE